MLLLAVGLVAIAPAAAEAQWVEEPGAGWISVTAYHQDTETVFDVEGRRAAFPGMAESVATQLFLTVAAGLLPGLDGWAQIPFQRLRFDDAQGMRTSTGFGDARLYLRVDPVRLVDRSFPLALRAGVKVPVGDFDLGSSLIPLGDGQRDWELLLEAGHSFYPRSLYVMGWVGYRWREAVEAGRRDFGDERFFYGAIGGTVAGVGGKLGLEGWRSDTPILNGVPAHGAEREMLRLSGSLLLDAGPGQVELGARHPLAGRNLPAGWDLLVGYFSRFRLP